MYVLRCQCKSVGSELSTGGPNAVGVVILRFVISIFTQDFVEVEPGLRMQC